MMEAVKLIMGIEGRINLIDVGCHSGRFTRHFKEAVAGREVFAVGVDPQMMVEETTFDRFFPWAVMDGAPRTAEFHHYSDASCDSLLAMTKNITHDQGERGKWFVARHIETECGIEQVPVFPLSAVIEHAGLAADTIHFVKIDAQGSDFGAMLSAGKYLRNCLFVQVETVYSHDRNIVLYEGQSIFEDERPQIEAEGFEVFSIFDCAAAGASPEADVIFQNIELSERLGIPRTGGKV